MKIFELPRSPFEAEHVKLEEGSLLTPPPRPSQFGWKLNDAERRAIGSSTGPVEHMAEDFNISPYYVQKLRRKYLRGEL